LPNPTLYTMHRRQEGWAVACWNSFHTLATHKHIWICLWTYTKIYTCLYKGSFGIGIYLVCRLLWHKSICNEIGSCMNTRFSSCYKTLIRHNCLYKMILTAALATVLGVTCKQDINVSESHQLPREFFS